MDKLWLLSQISIFDGISNEEMKVIDELNIIDSANRFSKNMLVQTPNKVFDGLFFVKEGRLKLYKLSTSGKQFTVGILSKGNVFGHFKSFSFGTRDMFIETMEPSLICSMSDAQFERLMMNQPHLAIKFLQLLSERLKERDDLLEQLVFSDLRGRILHLLSTLSAKFGEIQEDGYTVIDLPLSHQEIANMLSASRESVSAVMSKLAKEGVIKSARLSIQLAVHMLRN